VAICWSPLAIIDEACGDRRPTAGFIKLIGTAILIVAIGLTVAYFFIAR
jgi:hypothetical protein